MDERTMIEAVASGDRGEMENVLREAIRDLQQLRPQGQSYERVEDAWPAWVRAALVFGGVAPGRLSFWPGMEDLATAVEIANAGDEPWNGIRYDVVSIRMDGSPAIGSDRVAGTDHVLTYGGGRTYARLHIRYPHAWVYCGVYARRAPQTPAGLQSCAVSLEARLAAVASSTGR